MAAPQNDTAGILLCTCDACRYTFNPSVYHSKYRIPKQCPDCGKMKVDGRPAVREATEAEIANYWRIQEEMINELGLIAQVQNQ